MLDDFSWETSHNGARYTVKWFQSFTPLKQIPLDSRRQWKYLCPGVRLHSSSSALFWDFARPYWTVVHRCLVSPANPYLRLTERSGVFASFDIGETTRIDKLQGGVHGVNFGFGSSNDVDLNVSDSLFIEQLLLSITVYEWCILKTLQGFDVLSGQQALNVELHCASCSFWLIEWNKF